MRMLFETNTHGIISSTWIAYVLWAFFWATSMLHENDDTDDDDDANYNRCHRHHHEDIYAIMARGGRASNACANQHIVCMCVKTSTYKPYTVRILCIVQPNLTAISLLHMSCSTVVVFCGVSARTGFFCVGFVWFVRGRDCGFGWFGVSQGVRVTRAHCLHIGKRCRVLREIERERELYWIIQMHFRDEREHEKTGCPASEWNCTAWFFKLLISSLKPAQYWKSSARLLCFNHTFKNIMYTYFLLNNIYTRNARSWRTCKSVWCAPLYTEKHTHTHTKIHLRACTLSTLMNLSHIYIGYAYICTYGRISFVHIQACTTMYYSILTYV